MLKCCCFAVVRHRPLDWKGVSCLTEDDCGLNVVFCVVLVPGAWTGYCSLSFYTESFTILMGRWVSVIMFYAYTSLNLYFLRVCCNMAIGNESVYAVLGSSVGSWYGRAEQRSHFFPEL